MYIPGHIPRAFSLREHRQVGRFPHHCLLRGIFAVFCCDSEGFYVWYTADICCMILCATCQLTERGGNVIPSGFRGEKTSRGNVRGICPWGMSYSRQLEVKVHIHWRKCGCDGRDVTKPRRPSTHQISIETGLSLPVLCNGHHTLRSWSEVSEEMPCTRAEWSQPPWIHHAWFVVAKQP